MTVRPRIEKLHRNHDVDPFDCGEADLNRFLTRHALQSQNSNASQTYLALIESQTVGFYSLVYGQVEYVDAPERLKRGLARHPIPVMLLARLAVSLDWQRRGLGAALLKDAMSKTLRAADIAGIRAIVVHANNDSARAFYERFDFLPFPTDSHHLAVLLKDLRGIVTS